MSDEWANREDEFWKNLEAAPDDHVGRRVFSEWLYEIDDPRAEGMQALGELGRWPIYQGHFTRPGFCDILWPSVYINDQIQKGMFGPKTLEERADFISLRRAMLPSSWICEAKEVFRKLKTDEALRALILRKDDLALPDKLEDNEHWVCANTLRTVVSIAALAYKELTAGQKKWVATWASKPIVIEQLTESQVYRKLIHQRASRQRTTLKKLANQAAADVREYEKTVASVDEEHDENAEASSEAGRE